MKKQFIISALCVVLALILLFWGFGTGGEPSPVNAEAYGLLIQSDTGAFVMQLRKGMKQAADESGVQLIVGAAKEIAKAQGLAGVVVWLSDPAEAMGAFRELPLVVVDRNLPGAVCVVSDDEDAGRQLMTQALGSAAPQEIALICDDEDEHAAARTRAARGMAAARGVAAVPYGDPLALPKGCRVAVAASLRATRQLIAMKRAGGFAGSVMGVDTEQSRVSDLESGLVSAMALSSPYAMGYLALGKLREMVRGEKPESATTRVLVATPENMYLASNVKFVFPLLQ